jgi:hypothetical protein
VDTGFCAASRDTCFAFERLSKEEPVAALQAEPSWSNYIKQEQAKL